MKPTVIRTLSELKKRKNNGISFHDFGKGFSLSRRICDLKELG